MNLTSNFLGFELKNPIVPSASPLTGDVDTILALEEAGAAAVVLPSLFEEQIEHEAMAVHHALDYGMDFSPEATAGYFPEMDDYNTGPGDYLSLLARAKSETAIPVIASLNGTSTGGWTVYARILEDAGVDALELNIYLVAAEIAKAGIDVESDYLRLVESVRQAVSVPLAVKVGPFFSSMSNMAQRLVGAGANGLVLFNRFYQPDIDLEDLTIVPNLVLSTSDDLRLPLRWIAILKGRIEASLAATTGVHTADDVLKLILAGADVTMMAAALLKNGPQHITGIVEGVGEWLSERGYESVEQAKGSLSQASSPDPAAFERSNYMRTLTTYATES